MAERKKKDNLIVPNVLGLLPDIAGDVFDDHNVKYEIQDKKIISFFRDRNCVVKTVPKRGTSITPDTVVKVYTCKFKIWPCLLISLLLIIGILFILNKSGPTPLFFGAPVIDIDNKDYSESSIIYVKDDADFNYSTIDHYEYCISKNKNYNECSWEKTYTKSLRVSKSGVWYVWFKGISKDNDESYLSNRLKVQIDNESPIINNIDRTITTKSIEVRVNAKDLLSGVNKYYYSIDNHEYIEGNKSYTFTGLEENKKYNIKIRVVDKVGNVTDVETELSTFNSNKENESTIPTSIPQISMNDIPSYIYEHDDYSIPSNITPNKYKDNTKCYIDDKDIDNLKDLKVGKYKIRCEGILDNFKITTYKDIDVILPDGEDEIEDEYVRLNLVYPKEANTYMYRFVSDEVRVEGEGWNYYTNRLYVKKELVDKIIIKYNLNGEHIISRDNMFIDIVPDKYEVYDNEEVEVRINTNNTEGKIYYSVNSNDYIEYKNPFKVKGDSLINAYIETIYKSYDKELDMIVDNSDIKTDSVYIRNIYYPIGDKHNDDVSISLDRIPNEINNKEVYSIPSSYSYGTHGLFNMTCTADNKKVYNTSDLTDGEHDIICTITAMDGTTKQTSKHIKINKDNYTYSLDNIPSIIQQGDEYILDETCNIKNTSKLNVGKHNIVCNKTSKSIEVVKERVSYIDINNIPDEIVIGTLYQLPSHYYASNINYINCLDENKNVIYNTSSLGLGEHNIVCILVDDNNLLIASKTIMVNKPKYAIVISK